MSKKHYIDKLIDDVAAEAADGALMHWRDRLRDKTISLIEKEKDAAAAEWKAKVVALEKANGQLRLQIRKLEDGQDDV